MNRAQKCRVAASEVVKKKVITPEEIDLINSMINEAVSQGSFEISYYPKQYWYFDVLKSIFEEQGFKVTQAEAPSKSIKISW